MMVTDKRSMMALGLAALMSLGLAACAPEEEGSGVVEQATSAPAAERAPVAFTATEFTYAGPESIEGGWNQIEYTNDGQQSHALMFFQLLQGKTPADLASMPMDGPIPDWLSFAGGVGGIEGGKQATAVLNIPPGSYVITSFESAEGDEMPDIAKGMIHPLTVTAATAPDASQPVADVSIDMADYRFDTTGEFKAGPQMIKVTNNGPQVHEAIMMRLAEGVTGNDFVTMMSAQMTAPTGTTGAETSAMTSTTSSETSGAATTEMTSTESSATTGEATTAMTSTTLTDTTGAAPAESAPPGPGDGPPVTSAGGMGPLSVGASGFVTVDLTPGNYIFICFVPDSKDGRPHAVLGMVREITVQ